jgi:hypothetical protein
MEAGQQPDDPTPSPVLGDEQQQCWNQVFDILAEQVVLYPVLQVITPDGLLVRDCQPRPAPPSRASLASAPGVSLTDVVTALPNGCLLK